MHICSPNANFGKEIIGILLLLIFLFRVKNCLPLTCAAHTLFSITKIAFKLLIIHLKFVYFRSKLRFSYAAKHESFLTN